MTLDFIHTPVLLHETLQGLAPHAGGRYIDATVGGGGHAEKLLDMSSPSGTLLGIDADPSALVAARARLSKFGDRVVLTESYYDEFAVTLERTGFEHVDGVLFDLGVSSPQLDAGERGFSFQQDAPLDMRMGPTAGATAAQLVNTLTQSDLEHMFRDYGEERFSGRVARHVVEYRNQAPIETTSQLASIVIKAKPRSREPIHPATRVFQALRIAVNDELRRLDRALPQAARSLKSGGRLAVISFHSLEDRIVKRFMQSEARGCICPPEIPVCVCRHSPSLRIMTPKPITASPEELATNPRARSAKLRLAEKL